MSYYQLLVISIASNQWTVPPEVGNQTTVVVILDQEDQFWKYYNSLVTWDKTDGCGPAPIRFISLKYDLFLILCCLYLFPISPSSIITYSNKKSALKIYMSLLEGGIINSNRFQKSVITWCIGFIIHWLDFINKHISNLLKFIKISNTTISPSKPRIIYSQQSPQNNFCGLFCKCRRIFLTLKTKSWVC